jgi:SPP1 family predicted phage head-tail adaptor
MSLESVLDKYAEADALIERPTVSGFSQATTWAEVATVKAYIFVQSGNESIDYGGDNVRSTHRVLVAATGPQGVATDVTEADRITIDGKRYLVRFVDRKSLNGSGAWLQIDVEYIGAAA